jgi:multiple sugar transport system permease protein
MNRGGNWLNTSGNKTSVVQACSKSITKLKNKYTAKKVLNKSANVSWKLYRFLILFGLSFVLLYPLLYSLSVAFRPYDELFDPSVIWIPKTFTLYNIKDAFQAMDYPNSFMRTVKLNIVSSLLQVVSCALTGYGFARFKFKGKNLLFALMLFTIIVPSQTIIIPMYVSFRYFDFFGLGKIISLITGSSGTVSLIDTNWTFYIPSIFGVGLRSGLFIYIFRQFFRGLPRELEDAAYIDGCGPLSTFLRVMVPNSMQAFLTVFILSVVWHWNEYFLTSMYFLNKWTIATSLTGMTNRLSDTNYNPYAFVSKMQAGALLAIIPVLIMYIVLQKYFTESIERTGIVG